MGRIQKSGISPILLTRLPVWAYFATNALRLFGTLGNPKILFSISYLDHWTLRHKPLSWSWHTWAESIAKPQGGSSRQNVFQRIFFPEKKLLAKTKQNHFSGGRELHPWDKCTETILLQLYTCSSLATVSLLPPEVLVPQPCLEQAKTAQNCIRLLQNSFADFLRAFHGMYELRNAPKNTPISCKYHPWFVIVVRCVPPTYFCRHSPIHPNKSLNMFALCSEQQVQKFIDHKDPEIWCSFRLCSRAGIQMILTLSSWLFFPIQCTLTSSKTVNYRFRWGSRQNYATWRWQPSEGHSRKNFRTLWRSHRRSCAQFWLSTNFSQM